jgi:hypothetical protein
MEKTGLNRRKKIHAGFFLGSVNGYLAKCARNPGDRVTEV